MGSVAATAVPFDMLCRAVGLPVPVPEYVFHATRKWRLDYAWPHARVALEVDGGIYTGGRHVRPQGYVNDAIKLNEAAIEGWLVLRVVPTMLVDGSAIDWLQRALSVRGGLS